MAIETRLKIRGEDDTQRAFNSLNRSLTTLRGRLRVATTAGSGLGRSLRSAAGTIGLLGAGAGLVTLGREVITFNDNVAKLARALDQPVEQVSALAFAADLAGASFNEFAKLSREVLTASEDAGRGTKTVTDAFTALRIDAEAFGRLDLVQQFAVLSEALSEINDEGVALFAAEGIVGARNAANLINLAADGAEGLARGLRDAQASGAIIDPQQAAQAEGLVDTLARINATTRNAATQAISLGSSLGSSTAVATDNVAELARGLRQLREEVSAINTGPAALDESGFDSFLKIRERVDQVLKESDESGGDSLIGLQSAVESAIGRGAEDGAQALVATLLEEVQRGLLRQLASGIAGAIGGTGAGGFLGNLLSFDTGGVVPGPRGSAQLAVVHGGETILPTHTNPGAGTTNITVNAPNAAPGMEQKIAQAVQVAVKQAEANVYDRVRRR